MTENEEGLKTETDSASFIDGVLVVDLKLIAGRMGCEHDYFYEGEYTIVTGIGTNGFIVAAYPHRHGGKR